MKVYDFELQEAVKWSTKIIDKMKANSIDITKDDYFHKLEALEWTARTCNKCKEPIFANGQTRLCVTCHKRYTEFTEEGLIYGI